MKKPDIKVRNKTSNSQVVSTRKGTFLFSYGTLIAGAVGNDVYLNKDYWDYSAATGKHRNDFLGEGIAETRRKIESGVYKFFK